MVEARAAIARARGRELVRNLVLTGIILVGIVGTVLVVLRHQVDEA